MNKDDIVASYSQLSLIEKSARLKREHEYAVRLNDYFNNSLGSTYDKLVNFSKYVPRQTLTHFLAKYEIFKRIINVHGDIIECGVFLGGGLMTWAQLTSIFEPVYHMSRIIGFDTFEGFRDIHENDQGAKDSIHKKVGGASADSYKDLIECIELYDMNRHIGHIPKVQLIKGDIRKTLEEYIDSNPHLVVRLLYLDMDLYEPTKIAIQLLFPRMPKGAIIVFDELANPQWPGETKAVFETLGLNNLQLEKLPFHSALSFSVL